MHWWARCDVPDDHHPHCQVFNARGLLLHDGVFIVHEPPGAFDSGVIQIAPENSHAEYLWLRDGRVLLPPDHNTQSQRELIDDLARGLNSTIKR